MQESGTLYVITVNAENYRNNLFYDEVRRGINIGANLTDVNVDFIFGFHHDIEKFSDASGVIFAPDGSEECRRLIDALKERYGFPIVQFDNQVSDEKYAPYHDAFIGTDNIYGGKKTAEYLRTFLPERSRVLVIAGNKEFSYLSYNNRLSGFQQDDYFDVTEILYGEFSSELTYTELKKYFDGTKSIPDAIMAFNDDAAIIAKKIVDHKKIPKQIFITGFDGSAAGRAALSKGRILCSYDQNPEELGRQAFSLFQKILDGKEYQKETLLRGTLLTEKNIGVTFYPGVANFLDRSLSPFNFRKRRYELHDSSVGKQVDDFKKELICPLFFGPVDLIGGRLREIDADAFVVVSDNNDFLRGERSRIVSMLSQEGLTVHEVGFPGGENCKTPETLLQVIDDILEQKITKKTCIVLVGGGITGNVGGFAASILYRGIRFVHVPTTVMHMVDSSTGGKQAVDSRYGKNGLGSFLDPEFIYIDWGYLQSLLKRDLQSGLAECVKHALCQDTDLADFIVQHADDLLEKRDIDIWREVIERTIRLKTDVMNTDSYELNEGMSLVYGHTIGNAVESGSGYTLNHGEAVAFGMVAAARIAVRMGIAPASVSEAHERVLAACGLLYPLPEDIPFEKVMEFLMYDKKYVDQPLSFVLLADIGRIHMERGVVPKVVPRDIVEEVVKSLYKDTSIIEERI